jgi:hypothetical protein
MESDMSDLVSRMASVGAKSEVVNGSLSEKRLKIDKLVRVRRLLHVKSHDIVPVLYPSYLLVVSPLLFLPPECFLFSNIIEHTQRLEFIFDLPAKLNQCIDVGNYSEAVKYYVMSEQVLKNYSHLSSFQTIQNDANATITRLKSELVKSLAVDKTLYSLIFFLTICLSKPKSHKKKKKFPAYLYVHNMLSQRFFCFALQFKGCCHHFSK